MAMLVGLTTLIGASWGAGAGGRLCSENIVASASGTPATIKVYVRGSANAGHVIKTAIYNSAGTSLLAESAEWTATGTGSVGWVSMAVTGSPSALTSGTTYAVCVWYPYVTSSVNIVDLDGVSGAGTNWEIVTYGAWPATLARTNWYATNRIAFDVQDAAGVSLFPQVIMVL